MTGNQLISTIDSSGTKYHHPDHLSVRVTTDSSGNKIGQQGHYPYGEQWYASNTTSKWVFDSYERDSETGNDYAQARYHINRLGRFASPDPVAGSIGDPQSLNRYSYVRNAPIDLTDPHGTCYSYTMNGKSRGDTVRGDSGRDEDAAEYDIDGDDSTDIKEQATSNRTNPEDACGDNDYLGGGGVNYNGMDISSAIFQMLSGAEGATLAGGIGSFSINGKTFTAVSGAGNPVWVGEDGIEFDPGSQDGELSFPDFPDLSLWGLPFPTNAGQPQQGGVGGAGAGASTSAASSSKAKQQECAVQVVGKLFDMTGLSSLTSPAQVSVGSGNWINFASSNPVQQQDVLNLSVGNSQTFTSDLENLSSGARSVLNAPSLHLTGLSTGVPFTGHVDQFFWFNNPVGHAIEWLTKTTAQPCDLLKMLPQPQ